jgi:hypothetical protein
MLIGTVVRRDSFPVVAVVSVDISPIFSPSFRMYSGLHLLIVYPLYYPQVYKYERYKHLVGKQEGKPNGTNNDSKRKSGLTNSPKEREPS